MHYFITIRLNIILLVFSLFSCFYLKANTAPKKFVIVIDAGHGGEDSGAKGYGGVKEKDITLKIALSFGELIRKKHNDVTVLFTRETDVFIPLQERARIANKNKADLFVSIHCNAAKNISASGTETYVLGLHRNDENFEVSKRENAVIFLEDNYQEKYEGFDPNSPESVIGLTLLQNIHLDNSILFAKFIEDNHTSNERSSRGVKQAGFLVLRQAAMPSILTEIGFITNPEEGSSLDSYEGSGQVVNALYNSFKKYKEIVDDRLKVTGFEIKKTEVKENKIINKPTDNFDYKIQLLASKKLINKNSTKFKKVKPVEIVKQLETYKYYFGQTKSKQEAELSLDLAKKSGFKDAFITFR